MYYAHSTNDESRANWQPLPEHLIDTANLRREARATYRSRQSGAACRPAARPRKIYTGVSGAAAGAKERVDHSTAGAAIVQQLAKAASPMTGLSPN